MLFLCIALLAGCNDKKAPPATKQPAGKVLVIGLIPEQNIFRQMERYGPLAKYLQQRTGYQIKLEVLPRYGNIIDNFVSKGMDGAFFGSFTYTLAHAKLGVKVIARPENLYKSLIKCLDAVQIGALPLFSNTLTVLLPRLATARSGLPSPLRSADVTEIGSLAVA